MKISKENSWIKFALEDAGMKEVLYQNILEHVEHINDPTPEQEDAAIDALEILHDREDLRIEKEGHCCLSC